jgi:hypothetical protein
MTILFEAFVREPKLADTIHGPEWVVLAEIKKYVEGRLMPLKGEIEKEEQERSDDAPCTFILFPDGGLRFVGYSEGLRVKMKSSFENHERDIQILWLRIDEKMRNILGGGDND